MALLSNSHLSLIFNVCFGCSKEPSLSTSSMRWGVSAVLGAPKNRLIQTIILRTHNICLG